MTLRQPTVSSAWGGVELLERAIGYTRGCLTLVRPQLMDASTPCAGWDLRALLVHMDDSLASLHEAGSVRRVRTDVTPEVPDDLVDSLRRRACQLLADWTADSTTDRPTDRPAVRAAVRGADRPAVRGADRAADERRGASRDVLVGGRPLSCSVLTSAGALEVAVHGWDVAMACGAPRPLPPELAADLLRVAPVLVSPVDRPGRFGRALLVHPEASPAERLLAFLGRPGP